MIQAKNLENVCAPPVEQVSYKLFLYICLFPLVPCLAVIWQTRDNAKAAVAKEEAKVPKFDEKVELERVSNENGELDLTNKLKTVFEVNYRWRFVHFEE